MSQPQDPKAESDLSARFEEAAERLRLEGTAGGFLEMHWNGQISRQEVFCRVWELCFRDPALMARVLNDLAADNDETATEVRNGILNFQRRTEDGE